MRFNWRRHLVVTAFATLTALPFVGCSGGQQGADEQVAAEGQEGDSAEGQATAEEGSDQAVADEGAAATEQTASNPTDETTGENIATNTPANGASGNSDLQEIVSELQGNQTEQTAAATPAPEQAVPVADPAAAPAADPAAAPEAAAPVAAAPVAAAPGLPETGSKMPYVVEAGDTLAKLAVKIYGDQKRWRDIANLSGMSNPNHIYPGDLVYYTLDEASSKFAANYESVKRGKETVRDGDTLFAIAQRVYGSSKMWKHIWRQNDSIDNPDKLTAGMTIYYVEKGAVQAALKSTNNTTKTLAKSTIKTLLPAGKSLSKAHFNKVATVAANR